MADPQRVIVLEEEGRGCFGTGVATVLGLGSFLWLLNLGFGMLEIPDMLPFVGNIDEGVAAWLLFASLSYLGFEIMPDPAKAKRLVRKTVDGEVVEQ